MIKTFFIALTVAFAIQLDSAAAATSTVDSGAKPYLILGGLVAGLLFLSLGIMYLARGISRRQMAARSLQWPVTEGRILSASVNEMRSDSEGSDMKVYLPEASYSYTVAGKAYQGNVIRFGIEQFGYGVVERAQKHIERYEAGTPVSVHYDPDNSAVAVLEPGESGGTRNLIAGSLFFLVGIFCAVFTVWIISLGTQ
jgi:Protein of unknown function (DUF3592)